MLARAVCGTRSTVHRCLGSRSRHAFLSAPERQQHSSVCSMATSAVKRVAPTEAAELQQQGWTYLDVRTPEEYAAGHAPGSINIPLMLKGDAGLAPNPDFTEAVKKAFPDPAGSQLLVACARGGRSAKACTLLSDTYPNLIDNTAGWDGWSAAKLPSTTE